MNEAVMMVHKLMNLFDNLMIPNKLLTITISYTSSFTYSRMRGVLCFYRSTTNCIAFMVTIELEIKFV